MLVNTCSMLAACQEALENGDEQLVKDAKSVLSGLVLVIGLKYGTLPEELESRANRVWSYYQERLITHEDA